MPEPDLFFLTVADPRWSAFAAAHDQAHIFHHPVWTELLADCYGYRPFVVALRDAGNGIAAGLPMMEVHGLLAGRRWISLPFTDHCVPLCADNESFRSLAGSLVGLALEPSTPEIALRCDLAPQSAVQSYSHHVLHTLPLCADSDAVFGRFVPMHRRNIKVAEKKGVRIEWGNQQEHLAIFYRLHLETRRRKGVPIQPWRFFAALGTRLLERGLGFVLLAYKDDACLAAAVFLHWHTTLTYKFSASRLEGQSLCPNNLLLWTAIRWGCEHGYDVFDMGRTDLENAGLRSFKGGWGAEEIPLIYSTLSPGPAQQSRTDRLLPTMQMVIRKSPPWVCRAAGELLYKYFGV